MTVEMFSEVVGVSTPLRAHAFLRGLGEGIVQGIRVKKPLRSLNLRSLLQPVIEALDIATLFISVEPARADKLASDRRGRGREVARSIDDGLSLTSTSKGRNVSTILRHRVWQIRLGVSAVSRAG